MARTIPGAFGFVEETSIEDHAQIRSLAHKLLDAMDTSGVDIHNPFIGQVFLSMAFAFMSMGNITQEQARIVVEEQMAKLKKGM